MTHPATPPIVAATHATRSIVARSSLPLEARSPAATRSGSPGPAGARTIAGPPTPGVRVTTGIIVSYDGTPNDEDGLALGGLLARAGASVSLAYVRHSREFDPGREAMAQHDAERLLENGARW